MNDEIEDEDETKYDLSSSLISGSLCRIKEVDYFRFHEEKFGTWGCTTYFLQKTSLSYGTAYNGIEVNLSEVQASKAVALLRTKVWTARVKGLPPPFVHEDTIIDDDGYESAAEIPGYGTVQPTDMGRLYAEVASLPFNARCYYTLYNFSLAAPPGQYVALPYNLSDYPGEKLDGLTLLESHINEGLVYAGTDDEVPIMLRYLERQGLIEASENYGDEEEGGWMARLTPEGYSIASQMSHGLVSRAQKAFCVCRFVPELDKVYEEVYKPVGDAVGCPVYRVDRIPHLEVITDRILREIREATVVVVDMSVDGFNVGFEAGYAMSHGKQIIFTMRKKEGDVKLPFDVAGYSTILYSNLEELEEKFRERMLVAINLEKAKSQLPELPI